MRLMPRSIAGRLLALSALTIAAALAFATISIGHVLERFVMRGFDQQLDAEAHMLAGAVRPDGRLDMTRIVHLPAFQERGSGWGWRVESPAGTWVGGDQVAPSSVLRPPPPGIPPLPPGDAPALNAPRPGDDIAGGEPIHFRQLRIAINAGEAIVTASGPRRIALAPLREAMVPLLGSVALLGIALALATALSLRVGLRPLRNLQAMLAEVRAGRVRHIPSDQPEEIAPLAAELNALIDQNAAQLEHARRHVANLAHGLKTPLAALGVRLAESGRDPDGSLAAMVQEIDGRIRHHLGRARAGTPGGGGRPRTRLLPAIEDLAAVMRGIHAERAIDIDVDVAASIHLAVDPQDLDEMLGNLLDNACRHTGTSIAISARARGSLAEIVVDDDGPGLSDAAAREALVPGRRLDERGDGHGFGLSITQELAELNGGTLGLGRSETKGGLRVVLTLPVSANG